MNVPVAGLRYNLDLLYELTKKELKVRYKSSVLGYLWSVLNPLAMALVFYVGLGVILKVQGRAGRPYWLMLIGGLFPWQWFSNSVNASTHVYVANANLIRKVPFRRGLLPLATVLNDLLHFLASLPVIAVCLAIAHLAPSWAWLWGVPLLATAQLLLVYGVGLVVGGLNLFFRDLGNLVSILVQMLFYLSPVVYELKWIEQPALRRAILANPLTPLLEAWRGLLLDGRLDWAAAAWSLAGGAAVLAVGLLVHARLRDKLAEAA